MTTNETRQLGIEVERRLQIMDPTMESENKIDTETLYSMINEYQLSYLKQMILLANTKNENVSPIVTASSTTFIKDFIKSHTSIKTHVNEYEDKFELPKDMLVYISSQTEVRKYADDTRKGGLLNNILFTELEYAKCIPTPFDKHKIIRTPIVSLKVDENNETQLFLLHDMYTEPESVTITYYRIPKQCSILGEQHECEFPIECFDDLVTGTVELYMLKYRNGVKAATANQLKQTEKEDKK